MEGASRAADRPAVCIVKHSLAVPQIGETRTDDPEEEKKQKALTGLLNKLTPDNFERILGKMFDVGINAPKTLRGLIDRVRRS